MHVQMLVGPPPPGGRLERRFDDSQSYTCVEFALEDGATWVGIFGDGEVMKHHRVAVPFADGRTALIIANGKGYVVDGVTGELRYRTDIDYWATAITVPGRDFVMAAEFTTVSAIGRDRQLWSSERIALDGIILDTSTSEELQGKVWWWDGWYEFTVRYNDWTATRGRHLTTDSTAYHDPSA